MFWHDGWSREALRSAGSGSRYAKDRVAGVSNHRHPNTLTQDHCHAVFFVVLMKGILLASKANTFLHFGLNNFRPRRLAHHDGTKTYCLNFMSSLSSYDYTCMYEFRILDPVTPLRHQGCKVKEFVCGLLVRC
jgi:hypothetical protein